MKLGSRIVNSILAVFLCLSKIKNDEEILNFLVSLGKFGVPLNIVYGPNALNGIIFPEILRVKNVLSAINKAQ